MSYYNKRLPKNNLVLYDDHGDLLVKSPIDGSIITSVYSNKEIDVDLAINNAKQCFKILKTIPAPKRGDMIKLFSQKLCEQKNTLAELITLETGKIIQESLGEVQEMIDICDFAIGLSRQLYGLTITSERPDHRLMEQWLPLGPVVVISAFNFPCAVWAWNFTLAVVCGNPVIWKPSEKTPLTALACHNLWTTCQTDTIPENISQVLIGDKKIGELLAKNSSIALVSATGSSQMGREIAPIVASRFGRSLLELGGNNAMIVTQAANLSLATQAIVFSAIGTSGQRCTTLRRLIVHESIYEKLLIKLKKAYANVCIGSPLLKNIMMGPIFHKQAFYNMKLAIETAQKEGGTIEYGGYKVPYGYDDAYYVTPALISMPSQTNIVKQETFAPILYILKYTDLSDAINMNNDVEQGLSSSIFTNDMIEAELFMSTKGSDCGIVNVNIGTSGAEIGGAFGGEKATGGGRESGSDAWKNYMRRTTNTINYSSKLPLAQGIDFNLDK